MNRLASAAMVAVSMVSGGCQEADVLGAAPVVEAGGITVDSTLYHVITTEDEHEVTIEVSFTNTTSVEVRIPTCRIPHPPVLEKLQSGQWVLAYSPVVLLCLGPAVTIAPEEQYRMTYRVSAARRAKTYPRFEVDEISGTYRINWSALYTESGDRLPPNQRTSGPFQLME